MNDEIANPDWDGIERRISDPRTLRDLHDRIDARIRIHLDEHNKQEAERLERSFNELKSILISAFPDDDPKKHRDYHEDVMQYMKDNREMWKSIREKTLAGLIWAGVAALGAAIWQVIKTKLGHP